MLKKIGPKGDEDLKRINIKKMYVLPLNAKIVYKIL